MTTPDLQPRETTLARWGTPILFCTAGLLAVFHPTLLSGFARVQTDIGDTRLNNYVLEHSLRWITGRLPAGFWSPPIFSPVPDTAGYTDVLLGVAPLYWPWRLLGFEPDTSFQLWQLSVATADFVAMHWFLRRDLSLRPLPSATGAFLFAFGAPRVAQLMHFQLFAQFYSVLVLHGVYGAFAERGRTPAWRAWTAFGVGSVLQFLSGYYLAWLLAFALFLALIWTLARRASRVALLSIIREDRKPIAIVAALSGAALLPAVIPYLRAFMSVRFRPLTPTLAMLPRPGSWFAAAPDSWVYGWTSRLPWLQSLSFRHEHALFFGVVTLLLAAWGLKTGWRRPGVALMVAVGGTLFVLVTMWAPGWTLWQMFWAGFPGARALRSMGRVVLVLAIPVSIGVALAIEHLLQRKRTALAALLCSVTLVEQLHTTPSFDKQQVRDRVARYAATIPPGCRTFLLTPRLNAAEQPDWLIQIDPMWVSMLTGLATINGYSGNQPAGWPFHDAAILGSADEQRLEQALKDWEAKKNLDPETTCWVKPEG